MYPAPPQLRGGICVMVTYLCEGKRTWKKILEVNTFIVTNKSLFVTVTMICVMDSHMKDGERQPCLHP